MFGKKFILLLPELQNKKSKSNLTDKMYHTFCTMSVKIWRSNFITTVFWHFYIATKTAHGWALYQIFENFRKAKSKITKKKLFCTYFRFPNVSCQFDVIHAPTKHHLLPESTTEINYRDKISGRKAVDK